MSFKSFLKSIGNFFSKLFKGLSPIAKKAVDIGVTVTEAIKKFELDHPGAVDLLTQIVPGDKDDKAVALVREKLPEVMVQLRLVDATLGLTDPQEIVTAGIKAIQSLGGVFKITALNSLAIILSHIAADGKLDIDDAIYLAKWYYENKDIDDVDTKVNEDEN